MARSKTEEKEAPSLEAVIKEINKKFGAGTIINKDKPVNDIEFIHTGSLALDKVLGGGWARGRFIELFGPESSGKSTLALQAVVEVQMLGQKAAYLDLEHALDDKYMKSLGISLDELILTQPNSGEEALDICEMLVRSGQVSLIVIDSVAALVPQKELEGEMGSAQMGLQARLMSQAMRKLTAIAHQTKTTVIWINQIRMRLGVLYGNPESVTGGNALKFYASQRVDLRRKDAIKESDKIIGNITKAKIIKNKVAPPFGECFFSILFGKGIDRCQDVLDTAKEMELVTKSGAWYSYGERNNIAQGEASMLELLKTDTALFEEIFNKVKAG